MKLSRHTILTFAAAAMLATLPVEARQLTPDEALAAVSATVSGAPSRSRARYELVHTFKSADAALNTLYVFARPGDEGFMILSADDVAAPVLGYTDSGAFDSATLPANFKAWVDNYSAQIAAAAAAGGKVLSAPAQASYSDIAPVVTTHWNQDAPFNAATPVVNGAHCMTGCLATAIAQIIRHHEWPSKGIGTESYTWSGKTLSFDFANTSFDWANMLDDYPDGGATATEAQINAMATLMYAAGVASHMDYGTSSSGATTQYLYPNLISRLRYDKSMLAAPRDFFLLTEWVDMLYTDLAAGRPVLYTATTRYNEGHAFVIDGYNAADGLFHVNWGWGGMADGFFAITELDPEVQGIGGGSAGFIMNQNALLGLKKTEPGSTYTPLFIAYGFGTENSSYSHSGYVSFNYGGLLASYSLSSMGMEAGVKLVDKSSGATSYVWWLQDPVECPQYGGFQNTALPFAASDFPRSGTYTVTPVVRVGSRIVDVHVHATATRSLTLQCSSTNLVFTPDKVEPVLELVNIEQVGNYYPGKVANLSVTLRNTGNADYLNQPLLAGFKYGSSTFQFPNIVATVGAGSTSTFTFKGTLPENVPAGKYDLMMSYCDMQYNQFPISLGGAQVQVSESPQPGYVLELVSLDFPESVGGSGRVSRPYQIPVDPARFSMTVKCTSGYFDGYLGAYLFSGNSQVADTFDGPFSFGEGESRTVSFTESWASKMEEGVKYSVRPFHGVTDGTSTITANLFTKTVYITRVDAAGIAEVGDSAPEAAVYPNPAKDFAVVESACGLSRVEVYSVSGACVLSKDCTGDAVTLDTSSLPDGMYIIKAATGSGVHTLRLIKN